MSGNFIITSRNGASCKIPRALIPTTDTENGTNSKNYGILFELNTQGEEADLSEDYPIPYNLHISQEAMNTLPQIFEKFHAEPFELPPKPTALKTLPLLQKEQYGSLLHFSDTPHLDVEQLRDLMLIASFLTPGGPLTNLFGAAIAKHFQATPTTDTHKLTPTPDKPFSEEEFKIVEELNPDLRMDYNPPEPPKKEEEKKAESPAKRGREEETTMDEEESD